MIISFVIDHSNHAGEVLLRSYLIDILKWCLPLSLLFINRLEEFARSLLPVCMEHIWRAVNGIVFIGLFGSGVGCPDYINFGDGWANLISTMTTPSVVASSAIVTSDALEHVLALVERASA